MSGCQRLACRRRASWIARWSNGGSISRSRRDCSTSRTCAIPINGTRGEGPPQPYPGLPMAHQYVFTMHRLTKSFPPDREVLKDITLAFLPGAKIGVLGY